MERKGSKDLAKSSTFLVDQSYLGQAPKTFLIDRSDCNGDNVMFVADEVFVHGVFSRWNMLDLPGCDACLVKEFPLRGR